MLRPVLQEDEQRVQAWFGRVKALVEERRERYCTAGGTVRSDQHKRLEAELSEADKRMEARRYPLSIWPLPRPAGWRAV